jgi:hypothetical protein
MQALRTASPMLTVLPSMRIHMHKMLGFGGIMLVGIALAGVWNVEASFARS